jgi:hypothetical protein
MLRYVGLMLFLMAGLSGCAGNRATFQTPADHPASASADMASRHASSATLAVVEPVTVTPMPVMRMDHSQGHAKPTEDMEPADHDAMPSMDASEVPHEHEHSTTQSSGADVTPRTETPLYVCPMHPEVTSTDPAVRCPKCGMKLKARQIEEASK